MTAPSQQSQDSIICQIQPIQYPSNRNIINLSDIFRPTIQINQIYGFKITSKIDNSGSNISLKSDKDSAMQSNSKLPSMWIKIQSQILDNAKIQTQSKDNEREVKIKKKKENQTKNIPKNYGKAIISFIIKNKLILAQKMGIQIQRFESMIQYLTEQKNKINSIPDLRNLWVQSQYSELIRTVSQYFLRKHGFSYVFNSRISTIAIHVKYRTRLRAALKKPHFFNHIKQF